MTTPPSASGSGSGSKGQQQGGAAAAWSHEETVKLIEAYEEKWYSLKRGQLKSSQWEEVAVNVAARCEESGGQPSKTATQCRHKMEKLRQRHRAQKRRLALSLSVTWQYFHLMDSLERGPLPISARPMMIQHQDQDQEDEYEYEDHEHHLYEDVEKYRNSKSRSINCILTRPPIVNRFAGVVVDGDGNWGEPFAKKRREEQEEVEVEEAVDEDYDDEVEEMVEEEEKEQIGFKRGGELVLKLAGEIRGFADRLIGMENMKMEILKETQRCRMEMENKRMDMILRSHHKVVDSIAKAFESSNHFKMPQQEM